MSMCKTCLKDSKEHSKKLWHNSSKTGSVYALSKK